MLQAVEHNLFGNSNNSSSVTTTSTTTSTTTTTPNSEEKSQRRRSTFYVPLVIEDDIANDSSNSSIGTTITTNSSSRSTDSFTTTSTTAALEKKSSGGSKSSKEQKNSNNNNLKKSASLKNASATSKVAALLFERTNSSIGLTTNSSTKKMAPPCGFNWSITGMADADLDDGDSDGGEFIMAANRKQMELKSQKQNSPKVDKTNSSSSRNSSKATTPIKQLAQQQQKQVTAKTKRYGIVLNGISLDDENIDMTAAADCHNNLVIAPRTQLTEFENDDDDVIMADATAKTLEIPVNRTPIKHLATITVCNSLMQIDNYNADNRKTAVAAVTNATATNANAAVVVVAKNDGDYDEDDDNDDDDDDDDSEISRMQTNTSTPIKMMKSRSRTNILSVPSVEQHTLLNVVAAAGSVNSTPLSLRAKAKTLPQNLSPSVVLQQPEALHAHYSPRQQKQQQQQNSIITTTTTKLAKQSLFGGSTANYIGSSIVHPTSNIVSASYSSSASLITSTFPPKNLFLLKSTPKLFTNTTTTSNRDRGGIGIPTATMSSSTLTTGAFEQTPAQQPSGVVTKSKSKVSATKSFNSDTSLTSPPNATAAPYPPHPHQITSPAKKSLSFIRRAHSTKLSRNNSLLKSIASQHQQTMQQQTSVAASTAAGSAVFCTGSWSKDMYIGYDVCALTMDELEDFFSSERCAELIRERFKILDISCDEHENSGCAVGAVRQDQDTVINSIMTSKNCSASQHNLDENDEQYQQHGEHDGDNDDAGIHSGKLNHVVMCT